MSIAEELRAACPALRPQEPLSKHTSLAIGGPADYYAEVGSLQELILLRQLAAYYRLPVFFIGAGSNLLVADKGIRGLVIHLQGEFKRLSFDGLRVSAGAGAMMPTLAQQAGQRGLSGVESLIGVPGTIGGGLVMNAGTREGWLGDVVTFVYVLGESGKEEKLTSESFGFSYRHSNLEGRWVTRAELTLKTDDTASIIKRIETLLQYRSKTQPLTTANCGSVFKNPSEGPAAQWIEKAGFKNTAVGGARVSDRHANFIINEKNATAQNVRDLMKRIQTEVADKFHVTLEPEVKLVGDW